MPFQNPEGMCLINNNAIIATWDTAANSVYSIDITTDKIEQTFKTAGYAPQEVLVDKEQMLWVLGGNPTDNRTCTWTRIDPSTGDVLTSYTFPSAANTVRPNYLITLKTRYIL